METAPLKSFAPSARTALINEVTARIAVVLAPGSSERVEQGGAIAALEKAIDAAGRGDAGRAAVAEQVAYTWFNRIIALRFMDANGYTGVGVVSPQAGAEVGQPEILADAKRGVVDPDIVSNKVQETVSALLDGTRQSNDPQGEAYGLLLAEYCRYWHRAMPFIFERAGDFTELLMPANLLADDSVLNRAATVMTEKVCNDVEVIGWLYQFYISERKDEVFAGFKKGKKAGAAEIRSATQLFTPNWIVKYLVQNSLGRLWMLNRPNSRLAEQMDYYIAPVDEETDFLKIDSPDELTVMDPACGSGHMLTYAFDLLYAIYEEEGFAPAEIPSLILRKNLFGTEICPRSGALAAFALTMKARGRQRTFFNKQVKPNICVLDPISFGPEEVDILITRCGNRHVEADFWNQFAEADKLGSLIQPDADMTGQLARHLESLEDAGDMLKAAVMERAGRVIEQSKYLIQTFSVIVTNPPYMGSKNMDSRLAAFARDSFPNTKSDLFAMFVERCLNMSAPAGFVGLMTPFVWMFISTYAQLRQRLLDRETITTLIQLEYSGFEGATVPICACVLRHGRSDTRGAFVRLSAFIGPAVQGPKTLEIIRADRARGAGKDGGGMERNLYRIDSSEFAKIPGSPIAYWLSDAMRTAFTGTVEQRKRNATKGGEGDFLGKEVRVAKGITTGANAKFLRNWWEVAYSSIKFDRNVEESSSARWVSADKGGDFRRWYGNNEYIIDWRDDGREIINSPASTPRNLSTAFRRALACSKISSGDPAFRYHDNGFVFTDAAVSITGDDCDFEVLGAFLNSSTAREMLAALAPTLNFEVGQIRSLPLPLFSYGREEIAANFRKMLESSRCDWNSRETSWEFTRLVLLNIPGDLKSRTEVLSTRLADLSRNQQALEERTNQLVADSFGLAGEIEAAVPLHKVSLTSNVAFRYGPGKTSDGYGTLERTDIVADLISYAVGCMFGRYSLDEAGLILADQGVTVRDYLAKIPTPTFTPDTDNVIPIVDGDWFEDDIVARFRQFARVALGEQRFEDNLRFVTESLGVKDLRDYFVKSFYKDHVQRYKKRPIYWLFSSSKGSFNALIYMHRYTPSTVSTVLNEYLREYKAKLTASLENQERLAAGGGTPREQAAAQKEADRLRKVLLELDEYEHDVLYPLASQQIEIDLDDGVKVNYPKFGAALKRIPGLEAAE